MSTPHSVTSIIRMTTVQRILLSVVTASSTMLAPSHTPAGWRPPPRSTQPVHYRLLQRVRALARDENDVEWYSCTHAFGTRMGLDTGTGHIGNSSKIIEFSFWTGSSVHMGCGQEHLPEKVDTIFVYCIYWTTPCHSLWIIRYEIQRCKHIRTFCVILDRCVLIYKSLHEMKGRNASIQVPNFPILKSLGSLLTVDWSPYCN